MALFFRLGKPFMRSPEQGADTLVWLAVSPEVEGVSGKYFSDRKEIEAKEVAHDPAARRTLWTISEDLTGLKVAA
jgi:retinol dehydrogenase-14